MCGTEQIAAWTNFSYWLKCDEATEACLGARYSWRLSGANRSSSPCSKNTSGSGMARRDGRLAGRRQRGPPVTPGRAKGPLDHITFGNLIGVISPNYFLSSEGQ